MGENIKGAVSCKVCGRIFPLLIEEHYISRENDVTGLAAAIRSDEPDIWDSFDCPHCGCQNVVQKRKRILIPDLCSELGEESKEQEES